MQPVTHKSPVEKIAETAHFLRLGICSRTILLRGMIKSTKSDMMFTTAEVMIAAAELIHVPGTEGFQIFSRGMHSRAPTTMQAT